jgi:hypothetical protein
LSKTTLETSWHKLASAIGEPSRNASAIAPTNRSAARSLGRELQRASVAITLVGS